jgi:hypothetical protein
MNMFGILTAPRRPVIENPFQDQPLACRVCRVSFETRAELVRHASSQFHSTLQCDISDCEYWYCRNGEYHCHLRKEHLDKYRCNECLKECGHEFALGFHRSVTKHFPVMTHTRDTEALTTKHQHVIHANTAGSTAAPTGLNGKTISYSMFVGITIFKMMRPRLIGLGDISRNVARTRIALVLGLWGFQCMPNRTNHSRAGKNMRRTCGRSIMSPTCRAHNLVVTALVLKATSGWPTSDFISRRFMK